MTQVVMQIVRVKLRDDAKEHLTVAAHERVQQWLGQWTAPRNFQAVIAASEAETLAILKADLRDNLVPSWLADVRPEHFTFEVSNQKVVDGRFWMPSSITWCHDHNIPAKENQ